MFNRGIRKAIVVVMALSLMMGVGAMTYADRGVSPTWCQWGGNCPTSPVVG